MEDLDLLSRRVYDADFQGDVAALEGVSGEPNSRVAAEAELINYLVPLVHDVTYFCRMIAPRLIPLDSLNAIDPVVLKGVLRHGRI